MDDTYINQLLNEHFAQPVRHQSLPHLQREVWQAIAARNKPFFLARWLEDSFIGEMRFGPAFAAMLVGITLGYATLGAPAHSAYAASDELGFTVFSSPYSHPLQKAKL